MAASYATGTAISPTDLLQKLVAWLVAQGWTQNMSQAVGSSWRSHLNKNGQYVNLRSLENEHPDFADHYSGSLGYGISLYLGDGFSSGSAWNAQSGAPFLSGTTRAVGAGMLLAAGAISAYHFFDNGSDHVTVVVERTFGNCVHIGWGPSLVKLGYADDHWYFYGSTPGYYNVSGHEYPGTFATALAPMSISFLTNGGCATSFIRTDISVFASRWVGCCVDTSILSGSGYTGRLGKCALSTATSGNLHEFVEIGLMASRSWQTTFPGALLLPLHCFVASLAGRWIPVGYPPTVFYCGADGHGFGSGDIYTVGGVNYMLFPGFVVLKAA